MNCPVVSLILLTGVMNFCTIQGSCERAAGENCCVSGKFYDLLSQACKDCPPGFNGENCSMECRYPSYGRHCQSECKCSEGDCDSSTGCPHDRQKTSTKTGIFNGSEQEDESLTGSKGNVLDMERSPDVQLTPVLVSIVVVLIVILAAIVSRYTWGKYVVRRRKRELKHVEELLTYRHLGATNDNLYDMEEQNVDVDTEKNEKGPGTDDKSLKNDAGCSSETNKYFSKFDNLHGQGVGDEKGENDKGPDTIDGTFKNLKLLKSNRFSETDKNLYDNVCEETANTDNEKNGDEQVQLVNTTENDYVDSLAFKAEKKKSCRDSQHFYDSLK